MTARLRCLSPAPWPSIVALALSTLLVGCEGASDGDKTGADTGGATDSGGDGGDGGDFSLPASACGAAHAVLPPTGMGALLASERDPSLSLTAGAINALLASQGLAGVFTATYDVETYRVRYQTQDRGQLIEASGFVVVPKGAGAVPTLLWTHPTVGFADQCAPTAVGLEGAAFPMLFASAGFAVAAPDYLGMNGWGAASTQLHPYIVAEPTALASLDNLRALQAVLAGPAAALGTSADPAQLIHWGASEGGFAALWTDRYQAAYAPEFTTVATVAVVPPTDLQGLASYGVAGLSPTAAGLAGVLIGMDDWYAADDLLSVLQPGPAASLPVELRESCNDFPTIDAITAIDQLFTPALITAASSGDWSALPDWGCRLAESSLLDTIVPRGHDAPVFIVTAEADDLVVAAPTREDVPRLCDAGYDVQYHECAGASHTAGAANSLPVQWAWIQDRLAGRPLSGACVVGAPVECPPLTD
jgi:hypothetical protein